MVVVGYATWRIAREPHHAAIEWNACLISADPASRPVRLHARQVKFGRWQERTYRPAIDPPAAGGEEV